MMASKPKPNVSIKIEKELIQPPVMDTTDDREKDIERRLALLGDVTIQQSETQEKILEKTEEEKIQTETLLTVTNESTESNITTVDSKSPAPVVMDMVPDSSQDTPKTETKTPPVSSRANKNALLARIMAVQEKAKEAQMKKASTTEETPSTCVVSYKEKMMEAMNGSTEQATETSGPSQRLIPPQEQMENTSTEQTPFTSTSVATHKEKMMAALNVDVIVKEKKIDFLPPPFEVVDNALAKEKLEAPPTFEAIGENLIDVFAAPSAPPVEEHVSSLGPPPDLLSGFNLEGITPIVAPPSASDKPPSFESLQLQQQPNVDEQESDFCDFDVEGNKLSQEEKLRMMEEQHAILKQIQNQRSQNSASETAARATAFEMRSNAGVVDEGTMPVSVEVASTTDGIDHKVEHRSVDIGGGQKVALHGQEKTKDAIKNGTALLVKCLNCDNWMQVTATATLMFCPICSVVSPVLKEDNVCSKEEAIQLDADRKLAEQLQKQENERGASRGRTSEYPGVRRGGATNTTSETGSWLGGLLPASMWSDTGENTSRVGEISVTRPPGSLTASQSMLHSVNTGTNEGDPNDLQLEEESLLGSRIKNVNRLPAGRVAEQKPLFSCVVDSISSTANAVGGAISGYPDNSDVHGVDTTSFLSVTNAQRDDDNSGSYRAVPDH